MKFSKVCKRKIKNCTKNELKKFISLSFVHGVSRKLFTDNKFCKRSDVDIRYIKDKDDKIAAWLLSYHYDRNRFEIQLYVKNKYRRKGLGSRLAKVAAKEIIKNGYKVKYVGWDERSISLFKQCNKYFR